MMRKQFIILALALLLTGCGDTTVYIPEDDQQQDGIVVHIPVKPEKPTEEETDPATIPLETENTETEPEQTEPEQKATEPTNEKPSASSNKGNGSGNKNNSTNKNPSGGSTKPTEPQPEATEPVKTEPPATEPPVTEPPVTESPATEPPTEPPRYDISGYTVGSMEYAMLSRINEYRQAEGLEQLWLDEYLCAIASCRGYEASQVWSHTRPDGRNYGSVLSDYGYGGSASGELLGYATGDGAAVVDKWMSSDSHRALLMGSSYAIGIGIYYAGGVTYVACLLIG